MNRDPNRDRILAKPTTQEHRKPIGVKTTSSGTNYSLYGPSFNRSSVSDTFNMHFIPIVVRVEKERRILIGPW